MHCTGVLWQLGGSVWNVIPQLGSASPGWLTPVELWVCALEKHACGQTLPPRGCNHLQPLKVLLWICWQASSPSLLRGPCCSAEASS